jgi:hypothetical protein
VGGRLSRNVIKGGGVGEHGLGVKVRWGGVVSREKGTPEGFRGVAEGLTKFSSPLGEKHSLFTAKELTICFAEVRGGRWVMCEGETELLVEGFAFIVEPTVHGAGARGRLMGVLTSRVGVGIKGCLHEDRGKNLVFGCGGVQ